MVALSRVPAARWALVLLTWLGAALSSRAWVGGVYTPPVGLEGLLPVGALTDPRAALMLAVGLLLSGGLFLVRVVEEGAGWALVVLLALSAHLEVAVTGARAADPTLLLAGTVLLGWQVGRSIARDRLGARRDAWAHEVAVGALAAALALSALSRVTAPGASWTRGQGLLLTLYEGSLSGGWDAPLRGWLAASPGLVSALATSTLAVEALAPALVWPLARQPYAVALAPVTVAWWLLGAVHPAPVVLAAALAWSTLGEPEDTPPA